eukprot:TRINITY_DN8908_c0_g1_i1.p1 TRINITY_DN8908_c0_g1~~TRINITY_DN8908_c0_g1_i1.p1  ORF type:complete len:304 (+),score=52.74 TRINITY_DN8908_c0_g1_i1:1212-2123(+)
MNSQQLAMTKKIDNIAELGDRLTAALVFQRRALASIEAFMGDVLQESPRPTQASSPATATALAGAAVMAASGAGGLAGGAGLQPPQTDREMEAQNAQWVFDLKPLVVTFLLDEFTGARDASGAYVDVVDVNAFTEDCVCHRMQVEENEAVRLLERKWRLRLRPRRAAAVELAVASTSPPGESAQEVAVASSSAVCATRSKTVAYRYLHRAVSHFYQRIGNKAVAAFSCFINEQESIGMLRRVRSTLTKNEVIFSPMEARFMLEEDAFISEFRFCAGVIHALMGVFSLFGVLSRYSEPGSVPVG